MTGDQFGTTTPNAVLAAVIDAENADTARRELQRTFGLDDIQSGAVLEMQYGRVTVSERKRFLEEVRELTEQLAYLRSLEG